MKKRFLICFSIFFHLLIFTLPAQNITDYIFSADQAGYQPINGGIIISNNPSDDDQFFASQSIGFDFFYNNQLYNEIGVSINGFASFDDGTGVTYPILNNAVFNSLAPFSGNLRAQGGSELRIQTLGAAPNRVCVIQWSNFRWLGQGGSYNFQLRLYETTGEIQFHYGNFEHNGDNQLAQVGINGGLNDYLLRRLLAQEDPINYPFENWSTSNTFSAPNQNNGIAIRENAVPTEGLRLNYNAITDLAVELSVDKADYCIGDNAVVNLNIENTGIWNAHNVDVKFDLPSGLTLQEFNVSQGNYDAIQGIWSVGELSGQTNEEFQLIVEVNDLDAGNSITLLSEIISITPNDSDLSNNSSSININVINNFLPSISEINDQSVAYNGQSVPIPFTISDVETAADDLVLSIFSSNTTLMPLSGIQINGDGENRELVLNPSLNQFGLSTVTIEVSDGICAISESFEVEVFNQSFTNFQVANIVVGQLDFETVSTTASQTIAPGSNSSAVSAKGVLALGSQTTNRVLLWNSVPEENGAPANVVVGQANFTNTDANNTQNRLRAPDGVAFSPDGNKLIVADAGNHRLLIWNSIPTTNGVNADVVVGQTNFTNNGSGTAANRFNRPTDVQVTADGKMIVTDRNNNRVLIFNKIPTTNDASADVVIGQTNFTNNGQATQQNRLRTPWNTSVAPDGKLLIADDGNNRILVFNQIPTTNGVNADLVIGQDNFTSSETGITPNRLNSPGVTVSPSGVVAIACFNNHRVSIYNEVPSVNGASADVVLGQPDFTQNIAYNNGSGVSAGPSDRNMNQPYGINFDLNERLYVNGRAMNRMLVFGDTPNQTADLALSFSSSSNTPCVGGLVSYTVNVSNNGPNNATNVVVLAALPVGYIVEESTIDRGVYNQNSGFWTIPFIGNGETVSLQLEGTIETGENLNSITAYASVRSYNQFDSDFSNNSGSVTVVVEDNEAPSITEIEDVIIDFNESTAPIPFSIADTEVPANSLTVVGSSSDQSLVPDANITINGTGANRTVTISPAADQFGSVTITLTVEDGTCSTFTEFELFVGNVWLGTNNSWGQAANWSTGIPSEVLSAFIPTAPQGGNFPVINSDVTVNNISLSNNAQLTVNATRTLTVLGNFVNAGNATTGNGVIRFNGTELQTVEGLIGNMTIENANGVMLSANTSVLGSLNLQAGVLDVGIHELSIRNPIAGNAANLQTQATSSISIEGSTAGIILPNQVNELNNLSVNNGSGVDVSDNLIVNGELNLQNGSLRMYNNSLTINGTVNSISGNLSVESNANLFINGVGDAGLLMINPANNLFNNITINRTGSGQITVPDTIRVGGSFVFNAGKWVTESGLLWIENAAANSLTGYNESNYIIGNLRRCIAAANRFDFPLGSSANYEFSSLYINSLSESGCIDASFQQGLTGAMPSGLEVNGNTIDDVLDYGYWVFEPNSAALINYDINLVSRGHSNGAIASENHTIIKRDDELSDWELQGEYSTYNVSGNLNNPISVSRANLSAFSEFAIGVSSEGSLPVELIYFNAQKSGEFIKLAWETASEKDNDYFEIQRGFDPKEFSTIAIQKGKGNSHAITRYQFEDTEKLFGKVYYRLKQVDFDGQFDYSEIISVDLKNEAHAIKVFPNPSADFITIQLEREKILAVDIELFDNSGKSLYHQYFSEPAARIEGINLSILPNGLYHLKLFTQTKHGAVVDYGKVVISK